MVSQPGVERTDSGRIFLCHSSGDKEAVRKLYHDLRADGYNPWLDEQDLLPGQDWNLEIAIAVRSSAIVLVCLSRNAVNKTGYVQREIKQALDVATEQPEGSIFIIPVRLEPCDVPDRLGRWQWVDLFKEDGYARLRTALVRKGLAAQPVSGSPKTATGDEFAGVKSAAELKLALETIIVQTTFQGFKSEAQLERLRSLEKRFAPEWGRSGSVAELFGAAYVAARDIKGAIPWYERAVAASDGTASMKAADQLANVRVRLAWETVAKAQRHRDSIVACLNDASGGRRAMESKALAAAKRSLGAAEHALKASLRSARQLVNEAITLLEKLVALQSTIERESIYGSACRRLAMIEAVAGRTTAERRAIEAMKMHYRRAEAIARESQAPDRFYPALNYLAADLALNAGRRAWKGLDAAIVESARGSLQAKIRADPDFWSVVSQTDLELYQAIAAGKLASTWEALERGYQDLHKRLSAPWMWCSVYYTTHFVLQKYQLRASAKENKAAEMLLACLATFAQKTP